jgi:hypothetical protein
VRRPVLGWVGVLRTLADEPPVAPGAEERFHHGDAEGTEKGGAECRMLNVECWM